MLIYKILLPGEWDELETTGHFAGSPFDHASGFIHCSSRDQVAGTALRVFGADPALVIAAIDTVQLADSVRWEEAPGGEVFPHIYAALPLSAVAAMYRVPGASAVDQVIPHA